MVLPVENHLKPGANNNNNNREELLKFEDIFIFFFSYSPTSLLPKADFSGFGKKHKDSFNYGLPEEIRVKPFWVLA